jgi:HSP20 family protein
METRATPATTERSSAIPVERPAIDVSKREDQRQQSSGDAYRSERSYGSFYRAIPLPENVDPDQIKATFMNGVLEVTMPAPKAEQQGRKKIEVK